ESQTRVGSRGGVPRQRLGRNHGIEEREGQRHAHASQEGATGQVFLGDQHGYTSASILSRLQGVLGLPGTAPLLSRLRWLTEPRESSSGYQGKRTIKNPAVLIQVSWVSSGGTAPRGSPLVLPWNRRLSTPTKKRWLLSTATFKP